MISLAQNQKRLYNKQKVHNEENLPYGINKRDSIEGTGGGA